MNKSEQEILDNALNNMDALDLNISYSYKKLNSNFFDARLILKRGNNAYTFDVDIKKQITRQYLHQIPSSLNGSNTRCIVMASYIPETIKSILKDRKINYIEETGNCFINTEALLIYVNNKKSTSLRDREMGKLWKTAGLKFVFAILNDSELINRPYREIAEKANVALGTIGKFLRELEKEGFVKESKKNNMKFYFLERKTELIEKWSVLYNSILKPKNSYGYYTLYKGNIENLPMGMDMLWGGELAGKKLTNFLAPEKYIIYTWKSKNDIMKELRLIPDNNGNIELVKAFWSKSLSSYKDELVSPILVYADLIGSNDSRNHEIAYRIRKQYFDNK